MAALDKIKNNKITSIMAVIGMIIPIVYFTLDVKDWADKAVVNETELDDAKTEIITELRDEAAKTRITFLHFLEDKLQIASGGMYSAGEDFESNVIRDRNLITGQNPASSEAIAKEVIYALEEVISTDSIDKDVDPSPFACRIAQQQPQRNEDQPRRQIQQGFEQRIPEPGVQGC